MSTRVVLGFIPVLIVSCYGTPPSDVWSPPPPPPQPCPCDCPDGPPVPPALDTYCADTVNDGQVCCRNYEGTETGICRDHECAACREQEAAFKSFTSCYAPTCCAETVASLNAACAAIDRHYVEAVVCSDAPDVPTETDDRMCVKTTTIMCAWGGAAELAIWCCTP